MNANKIPYSVASPGGVIFKDDVWVGDEPGQGLTCATFLIALFDELGIPFIAKDSWQSRPGDEDWSESILVMLSALMTKDHVDAQRSRIGEVVRIRPSDITSAAHHINQELSEPLTFEKVAPLAAVIEEYMIS